MAILRLKQLINPTKSKVVSDTTSIKQKTSDLWQKYIPFNQSLSSVTTEIPECYITIPHRFASKANQEKASEAFIL